MSDWDWKTPTFIFKSHEELPYVIWDVSHNSNIITDETTLYSHWFISFLTSISNILVSIVLNCSEYLLSIFRVRFMLLIFLFQALHNKIRYILLETRWILRPLFVNILHKSQNRAQISEIEKAVDVNYYHVEEIP